MKTKLLVVLLVIAMVFGLAACGTAPANNASNDAAPAGNTENNTAEPEPPADESLVVINGYEFHLDKDAAFKDLHYTVSGDFKENDHGNYIQYNYYQKDDSNLFFFRVFYYKLAGDVAIAVKDLGLDSGIKLTDGKNGDLEYKFYERPREDGGTMHFYFIKHEEDVYAVTFTCKYDINDFEAKVVKSLKF